MTCDRFLWGSGDGARLHAPGFPDTIAGSEGSIAWVNRCGVWHWVDKEIRLYSLDEVVGLVVSPQSLVVVNVCGSEYVVHVIARSDGSIRLSRAYESRAVDAGTDVLVLDEGTERIAVDVCTGRPFPLPVGARDARPKPWSQGAGVVWVDQSQVYRLSFDGRPQSVGRLASPPNAWVVGPYGAAVFACEGSTYGMAPGGGLVALPPLHMETVRFSDQGDDLLAVSEAGVLHIALGDGGVRRECRGFVVPVGISKDPVVFDEDAGLLKYMGGAQIRDGFAPCAVSRFKDRLYGPGGTAWDLSEQKRVWAHTPLGGLHLVAHRGGVFQIDERIVGFNDAGEHISNVPFPVDEDIDGEVLFVRHCGDGFEVHTDQDVVRISSNGERTASVSRTDAETGLGSAGFAAASVIDRPWAVGVDGSCTVAGRLWCWNEDGMLFSVPDSYVKQNR